MMKTEMSEWLKFLLELLDTKKLLILIVVIATVAIISNLLKSWIRTVRFAFSLSGPPALPIFGNIFYLKNSKEFMKTADTVVQNYGKLFRVWLTTIPLIMVVEPKYIQIILGSTKLTDKNFLYSLMHTFIGNGLITNNGYRWKFHRRSIQPYFHINNLEVFVPMFSEAAQAMTENLNGLKTVKITKHINNCIIDILHLTILGIPLDEKFRTKNSPIRSGSLLLLERIMKPWLLLNMAYNFTTSSKMELNHSLTLREFIHNILEERKIAKLKGHIRNYCLLDIFLEISEDNKEFTDEDIINEACTFLLAGQDSVGAATAFTFYYLAKHEDIQEKVIKEIDEVILETNSLNVDSLNKMKYLEQCIKETMRLIPSVPLIARKLSEDVKLDNHVIPAGSDVLISPYLTHRLAEYYPNPEEFDPDRFSTDSQKMPFAYIPFSAGPRNCIGYKFAMLEMKIIILTLLRKFKVKLAPGYELNLYYRVTMRTRGGVALQLFPR